MATTEPPASAPMFSATPRGRRYSTAAMTLHWTIAVLILVQIGLGWYMNEVLPDHSDAQDRIETLHISIGLTTLGLILIRIALRLFNPPPPQPAALPQWERTLAGASHLLFYVLMLAMPLSGWILQSVRPEELHFWGFNWPYLPGLGAITGRAHRPVHEFLKELHTDYLVWIALANVALHVAGALKHQFDGRPVLWRMVPFLKRP